MSLHEGWCGRGGRTTHFTNLRFCTLRVRYSEWGMGGIVWLVPSFFGSISYFDGFINLFVIIVTKGKRRPSTPKMKPKNLEKRALTGGEMRSPIKVPCTRSCDSCTRLCPCADVSPKSRELFAPTCRFVADMKSFLFPSKTCGGLCSECV